MLLPALLVTTLLYGVNAERNLTAEAQAFVSKFREINETTDPLSRLERIGKDSRELFKLGRSVGHLLRTFNKTGKVTDDETTALAELNQLFKYKFLHAADTNSSVEIAYSEIPNDSMLESMRESLSFLTNAAKRSERRGQIMLQHIKTLRRMKTQISDLNPLAVLDMIDSQSRLGCGLPTKEGIRLVGRLQDALWRVELGARGRWNVSDVQYAERYKTGILYMISSAKMEEFVENLIKNLDEMISPSIHDVAELLSASHIEILSNQTITMLETTMCVLEYTMDKSAFNQTALMQRMRFLYKDFIRVHLLEWAFSSFIEVDDESYNDDAEITSLMLERTAKFLVKWTRTVQNVSWPEIGIEFAKRAIDLTVSPTPAAAYNETARRVQKAFEEHGASSYSYQVLVVPTGEVGITWSVGSARMEDYANITDFNGLDIHVFRFNRSEIGERSVIANKWMKNNVQGLKKQIGLGAFSSTSSMLSILQTESSVGPIYSDDLFRSVVLLTKTTISPSIPDMPIGFALSEYASNKVEVMRTSYSVLGHGKETVYAWKAFFFL